MALSWLLLLLPPCLPLPHLPLGVTLEHQRLLQPTTQPPYHRLVGTNMYEKYGECQNLLSAFSLQKKLN